MGTKISFIVVIICFGYVLYMLGLTREDIAHLSPEEKASDVMSIIFLALIGSIAFIVLLVNIVKNFRRNQN